MANAAPAVATPWRTDRKTRWGIARKVLRKIMVLVGVMTTASFAGLFALCVLGATVATHIVVDEDGQVLYCDQVGMAFADDFDNQGRWLKGYHIWTCDGRTVRTDEFTSEAADLGLP